MRFVLRFIACLLLVLSNSLWLVSYAQPLELVQKLSHKAEITALKWSPDNQTLASASQDGTIKLWSGTGYYLRTLQGHTSRVNSVFWSADGQRLATYSDDKTIKIWRATTGQLQSSLGAPNGPSVEISWSNAGGKIAVSSENNVQLVDTVSGQSFRQFKTQSDGHNAVVWSPDDRRLATGSKSGRILIWSVATGQREHILKVPAKLATPISWTAPDILHVAGDKTIWESRDSKKFVVIHQLMIPDGRQRNDSMCWSPDGKRGVEVINEPKAVNVWDAATGKALKTFKNVTLNPKVLSWSHDSQKIATADGANVQIWNWGRLSDVVATVCGFSFSASDFDESGKIISIGGGGIVYSWGGLSLRLAETPQGITKPIEAVSWHPSGERLLHELSDGRFVSWSISEKSTGRTFEGHHDYTETVAWSPDGNLIASGGGAVDDGNDEHNAVKIWGGSEVKKLTGHVERVIYVAWSPDGKRLASGSADHTAIIWDVASGKMVHGFGPLGEPVGALAWSPDSKTLAVGGFEGGGKGHVVQLLDAETGQLIRKLQGHEGNVLFVGWSPDGKWIASGSSDRSIKIWDAKTGELQRTLLGHRGRISGLAWRSDSKTLATGSDEDFYETDSMRKRDDESNHGQGNTVKVWDATTGRLLHTLYGHKAGVNTVTWHPDDQTLTSSSNDGTIRFWIFTGEPESAPPTALTVYPLDRGGYVTIDSQGRFDSYRSANGEVSTGSLHYVRGLEVVELSQLADGYHVPDLLGKVRRGEKLPPVGDLQKFAPPELQIAPSATNEKGLDIQLTNRGQGIGRVEIWLKDRRFSKDARAANFDANQRKATVQVTLPESLRDRKTVYTVEVRAYSLDGGTYRSQTKQF